MDDLLNLELLSLVSRVTSELQNHLGVSDKTLAEFIIAQRVDSKDYDVFKQKLAAIGADLPPSLIESVDRLVLTMHPKMKGQAKRNGSDEQHQHQRSAQEKEELFKGLSVPDKPVAYDGIGDADAIDDTLALLEGLEGKAKGEKSSGRRKRSRSPDREKKRRYRSRSREGRREKHRSRSRSRSLDEFESGPPLKQKRGRRRHGDDDRDEREDRHRRYDRDDDRFKRAPEPELDDAPQLHKVYDGHVTGIKDFGAFVNIHGVRGKVDGLVHISRLVEGQRVNHPSDLLTREQDVKVKVVNIEGNRIGLSMKEVDQETGMDAHPQDRISSGANMQALGGGRNGNMFDDGVMPPPQHQAGQRRHKKRMTSPERWEIRQLIASGVAKASDYPDLEEDYNATLTGDGGLELEEDVDIEVREEEPPFLAGQTKQSLELSPIRVVKAPDGSMNRAAMSGAAIAKERKELKQQEAEAEAAAEESKVDLSAQWNDPMADPEKRKFASDLRNAKSQMGQNKTEAVPEWKRAVAPKDQSFGKRTNLSIKEQRESLPVFHFRRKFLDAVREHQVLVVIGETGSGKTTQLTQYLAEDGFANDGVIGCTQPRRVAAMSVAKRVAEEVGTPLGEAVGYTIRFEDRTSPATRIKYMTDGMLQREILVDPDLRRYSVIMLDEAHERTISTDVLFALLKKTMKRRKDLKVIATSATLDADKFSSYFDGCPIFTIPGRTFPVEVLYSRESESDYLDAALQTVMEIHLNELPGDILLFLTGQEEIDTACEILYERMKALGKTPAGELIILPVYSALPNEMQSRIFDPAPPGCRKVVIATNIAETSITIDNIYFVVDPGFVKQNAYDPKLGMDSLVVTPISQAQANQRAGRAGRTGPGKCFRLYTEAAYQSEMLPTTIPEIQRQNLSHVILMLKAMGINDLLHFDFMDPPPINTMLTALEELYALSALDDEGLLTRLGRKMADFPMEPSLAKVLIISIDMKCSAEMLIIVAMLNLPNVFYRPKEKQSQADQKKAKFHDPHGDHLTLLNVYNSWKQSGFSSPWCFENFIQARSMKRAKDVLDQLVKIMDRYRHPVISCGRNTQIVRQVLCSGFFRNAARKDPQEGYKTLIEGTPVYLHPSSALFGKQAEWVIYHTLVLTTKEYMHCTTSIEPKWLVEAAPTFFKVAPTDKLSKRKKAERIQPLHNKYAGEDDWRLSAQRKAGRGGGGGGTWG
ncbi:Pre-mRNA-splicing factor ATP-dependent RNA helicase prp22 [Colletotrichum orbiculare MAFF 240422]|uniref:RNA helicase n=1 Tax=Colletotrichum orbiculare (strain 104-T / ATCC 96160 / CBS 514.97 / LARS 414 / MAFF 240422) TaxID=1213857 RepID=N4V2Z9_COLOR|nr:Pre-mRNA-splicing factor ATP-dependent RNA helicase prp22 [Colletotrichum orbiculare MAFF 240422]